MSIPPWISLLAVLSLIGIKFASGYRLLRAEGRAIRPVMPGDALFGESGASGCSEVNTLSKMAGANRILLVSVTKTELVVESAFPFNIFMPVSSFQCRVSIDSILNACQVDRNSVRVELPGPSRPWTLRLYLKRPEQFVHVLSELGVPSKQSPEQAL